MTTGVSGTGREEGYSLFRPKTEMPYPAHVLALPLRGTRDARLFTDSSNAARGTAAEILVPAGS